MHQCRYASLWTAALWSAAALAAQTAPPDAAVQRGRQQFQQACGFCHGEDATGNRAPDLIRSATLGHDVNGDHLGPILQSGFPDKGMPAFRMTAAQIADIAAFLHHQARAALMSGHVSRDYPLEKLLTGNAEAGKSYFNGSGGCAKCHSAAGDLAGVAAKFKPIELQNRMLYPRGAASTVQVTLPDGRTFRGRLEHLDEFSVALLDAPGWEHSWQRSPALKVEVHDPLEQHRELLFRLSDADVHNLFAYLETLK